MAGRPTRLTPAVQKQVLQAVASGAFFETAFAFAGIEKNTYRDWLKKGRKGQKPYADLVAKLDQALAESEIFALAAINASPQWQAHAWFLERKWPERYGRRWAVLPEPPEDGQMISDEQLSEMTNDELEAVIDAVAKASAKRLATAEKE